MWDCCSAVLCRNRYIPDPEVVFRHGVGVRVPIICEYQPSNLDNSKTGHTKFADQRSFFGIGCPFPVFDLAVRLRMKTEGFVALEESTTGLVFFWFKEHLPC